MAKIKGVLDLLIELDDLGAVWVGRHPDRYELVIYPCVCRSCAHRQMPEEPPQRVTRAVKRLGLQLLPMLRKLPRYFLQMDQSNYEWQ